MASGDVIVLQIVLKWPYFLLKPTNMNGDFIDTEGGGKYPLVYTNNPYFIEHTKVTHEKIPKKKLKSTMKLFSPL